MYIGNVSDFFYKSKDWLMNQPKVVKDNKFQFFKVGGKLFKFNILTGLLSEVNKNDNPNVLENSLKPKRINNNNNLKIEKININ